MWSSQEFTPLPRCPRRLVVLFDRFQYTSLEEDDLDKPRECEQPDCLIPVSGVSIVCSSPNYWTLPPGMTPVPTMAPPENTLAPVQGAGGTPTSSDGVSELNRLLTAVQVYPPVIVVSFVMILCSVVSESPTTYRTICNPLLPSATSPDAVLRGARHGRIVGVVLGSLAVDCM